MRVLLTSPSMQVGGAERVMTLLAAELVKRGHEVAVVAPPGPRDAKHSVDESGDIRCRCAFDQEADFQAKTLA